MCGSTLTQDLRGGFCGTSLSLSSCLLTQNLRGSFCASFLSPRNCWLTQDLRGDHRGGFLFFSSCLLTEDLRYDFLFSTCFLTTSFQLFRCSWNPISFAWPRRAPGIDYGPKHGKCVARLETQANCLLSIQSAPVRAFLGTALFVFSLPEFPDHDCFFFPYSGRRLFYPLGA